MAKNNKTSKARRLHRFLGAGAAIFIIFMVLSGLVINHSNGLGLDHRKVSQTFILDWYGLGEPEHIRSFALGKDWLSFAGSQLYLNGKHIAMVSDGVGAVINGDLFIAAGSDELLLLDHTGNLIERTTWGPPGTGMIDSIGLLPDGSVVVSSIGQLWLADSEILNWRQISDAPSSLTWSLPTVAPEVVHKAIKQQYRGDGLSLERVLLDFHSGRVFGSLGILIYDLLALAIGFMAISGLILWFRGRRNGNRAK